MIKQECIDKVKDTADLTELMGLYTTVKGKTACCPFHNESTPSLNIKNNEFYKCFGCGKYGNAVQLIMEKEKKTFVEAIEWLANYYHITVEYDQQSAQEAEERRERKSEMLATTAFAYGIYTKALQDLPADAPAIRYLQGRGYDKQGAAAAGFGYAPADFTFLTQKIISKGLYSPAEECGLVSTKQGNTRDFFINRIIIPIHDQNGVVIGLAGRLVPSGDKEKDKKYPKYLNPKESIIYSKAKVWYGLWRAARAIKERGFAYVCEGYFDVDSMQAAGNDNTVASCGTAIDVLQAKFLRRFTDHACLCYDGDKPGLDKMETHIDMFLSLDFKVSVVELPGKQDPDEFIRNYQVDVLEPEDGAFAE